VLTGGRDSRGDAHGAVGDHGGRRASAGEKRSDCDRLSAIEELAGVDVLCSDKTGTLTQNKLTLGDPFTVNGIPCRPGHSLGALASRAEDKDTIDLAVIGGVKDDKEALKSYQVLHFQPFDPVHKRTEATVKGADGKQFFVAKGAPQVILEMSTNAGEVKPAVEKAVNEFAGAASVPWAWPGRIRKASGSLSACCRCSIRRASRPKPPSPAPGRWA
jgi:magnesium-transporting ATPase (P-type)